LRPLGVIFAEAGTWHPELIAFGVLAAGRGLQACLP